MNGIGEQTWRRRGFISRRLSRRRVPSRLTSWDTPPSGWWVDARCVDYCSRTVPPTQQTLTPHQSHTKSNPQMADG
eukprot:5993142-Pyramimonas_sp.AAC.3